MTFAELPDEFRFKLEFPYFGDNARIVDSVSVMTARQFCLFKGYTKEEVAEFEAVLRAWSNGEEEEEEEEAPVSEENKTRELKTFGFTSKEVRQIIAHGWVRHKDSDRFNGAALKAAESERYHVTPPNWPNANDPDSGWYIIRKTGA
jgi:hypothetical protein